ncbi:MAG: hypothetical protein JWR25_1220 [Noviherbaspirillum sp.]|nr:hypothetical protein [Noviherbaspirillum sp.]
MIKISTNTTTPINLDQPGKSDDTLTQLHRKHMNALTDCMELGHADIKPYGGEVSDIDTKSSDDIIKMLHNIDCTFDDHKFKEIKEKLEEYKNDLEKTLNDGKSETQSAAVFKQLAATLKELSKKGRTGQEGSEDILVEHTKKSTDVDFAQLLIEDIQNKDFQEIYQKCKERYFLKASEKNEEIAIGKIIYRKICGTKKIIDLKVLEDRIRKNPYKYKVNTIAVIRKRDRDQFFISGRKNNTGYNRFNSHKKKNNLVVVNSFFPKLKEIEKGFPNGYFDEKDAMLSELKNRRARKDLPIISGDELPKLGLKPSPIVCGKLGYDHITEYEYTPFITTLNELKKSIDLVYLKKIASSESCPYRFAADCLYEQIIRLPEVKLTRETEANLARLNLFLSMIVYSSNNDSQRFYGFFTAIQKEYLLWIDTYNRVEGNEPLISHKEFIESHRKEFLGTGEEDLGILSIPAEESKDLATHALPANSGMNSFLKALWETNYLAEGNKYKVLGESGKTLYFEMPFPIDVWKAANKMMEAEKFPHVYIANASPIVEFPGAAGKANPGKNINEIIKEHRGSFNCAVVVDITSADYSDLKLNEDSRAKLLAGYVTLVFWESGQKYGQFGADIAQYGRVVTIGAPENIEKLAEIQSSEELAKEMKRSDITLGAMFQLCGSKGLHDYRQRSMKNGEVLREKNKESMFDHGDFNSPFAVRRSELGKYGFLPQRDSFGFAITIELKNRIAAGVEQKSELLIKQNALSKINDTLGKELNEIMSSTEMFSKEQDGLMSRAHKEFIKTIYQELKEVCQKSPKKLSYEEWLDLFSLFLIVEISWQKELINDVLEEEDGSNVQENFKIINEFCQKIYRDKEYFSELTTTVLGSKQPLRYMSNVYGKQIHYLKTH